MTECKTEYKTPKEIAEMLNVSERTIRKKIHSGEIPALQIGRHYRISTADIFKHLQYEAEEE